jgi:hypothetical protein
MYCHVWFNQLTSNPRSILDDQINQSIIPIYLIHFFCCWDKSSIFCANFSRFMRVK